MHARRAGAVAELEARDGLDRLPWRAMARSASRVRPRRPGRRQGGATAMAGSALSPAPGGRDVGIEPIGIRRPRPRHPRSAPDSKGTSATSASALARSLGHGGGTGTGTAAGMSPRPRMAAARLMTSGAQP